jgi:hypothetical protein
MLLVMVCVPIQGVSLQVLQLGTEMHLELYIAQALYSQVYLKWWCNYSGTTDSYIVSVIFYGTLMGFIP